MIKTKSTKKDKPSAKRVVSKDAKVLKVKKKDFDKLLLAMSNSAKKKSASKE